MKARPVLFLVVSLCNSFVLIFADGSVESRRFERRHTTSRLTVNVPGGEVRSLLHCGALCASSSSCKAYCYSRSTALCHLSQPYVPIAQEYDVTPDSKCYKPTGCPMSKGYAWYGARCIKGYADKKNYTDARAICMRDGSHLYHFKDLEWDVQPIVDLKADDVTMDDALWVGADRLLTAGQYKWSDSSLLASGASVWAEDNPTSISDYVCVMLRRVENSVFNFWCRAPRKFVCQIDV